MNTTEEFFVGDTDVVRLMRAKDFGATALGEPTSWPQSLRTIVRMMLSSRYQMWMGWGPDLHFFYNDAYRPTLGAKHPWALAMPAREVWSEIWDAIGPRIRRVLDAGEATWDEALLLLLERNGYPEETYHTFSYSPVFDDEGRIGGLMCVVIEETERIITERRLAVVREFSARLAGSNATPDVMDAMRAALPTVARDLPFTLTYLFDDDAPTARLAAQTGFPEGHAALARDLDPEASDVWPILGALQSTAPTIVDLPAAMHWPAGPWAQPPRAAMLVPIAQQGQARPAGVFIAGVNPHRPIDDAYRSFLTLFVGQVAAGLANARAYAQERRRAEALAQLDRAKTAFFSNVSHEFRTPLTLMLGPIEDLRANTSDPDVRDRATLVHRSALRLLRLVNTLLDFSRIEAGRAQATYQATDLARFTEDLVSLFRSATDRAGLRLLVRATPLDEPVYVDRDMWEKIVLNLVSNAFKYTLDGEIEVTLRRAGDRAELRVRDTGIGIAADELPRLFERFHRVEGARGRTHEGTGIGLALVHELVAQHGGTVGVESDVNRGSVFAVSIPLGRAHLPADRVHDSSAAAAPGRSRDAYLEEALQWLPGDGAAADTSTLAAPAASAGRVLLADDNVDMRDYLKRLLQSRWNVEAVANGQQALDAIRRARPDVLVTDVMMPELDGLALLQILRCDPTLRDLPVIMLSARAGEEASLEGIRAGADDYLVKPFSARELLTRVEAQLLRGRIRAVEEEHARRQATMFAQAPVAIALLRGPDHVYELANPRYLALVGNRPLLGVPIRHALPELEGQAIFERLDLVRATGAPYIGRGVRVDIVAATADSAPEERFFDFVYQPIVDGHGRVDAIAVVCTDVTDVTRARREAEIASRAKDEFLAMLGHELRNPLAPILTALQLLRLRGVSAGEKERAVIERQVKHLVSLVDDLLDVSRITRGKIQLRHAHVSIAEAVAKAIETTSPLLEQKSHDVRIDIDDGLAVVGDQDRLAQVVANVLTNAAKYTEEGGHITMTGRLERGEVVLRVRDTGIGIAADMLPRIFDLFVQERQAIDRAQGGLGLGLAIVRSLVELHGGRVEARSAGPGTGAEFVIWLPAAPAAARSAAADDRPSLARVEPASIARRVLIVDDNADAADLMRDALVLQGHLVRVAADGLSALRIAEGFAPDVALVDIGLPVIDGYEVARRFAQHERLQTTHLIAVTGYGQERDRQRSAAAGFAAHLVKPLDLEQLRQIFESVYDAGATSPKR